MEASNSNGLPQTCCIADHQKMTVLLLEHLQSQQCDAQYRVMTTYYQLP